MLRFKSNYFKLFMKINGVKFGKQLTLIGLPIIFRAQGAQIQIGKKCLIKSSFLSNLIGLYQRTIIVARGEGKIIIGNHVGMSGVTVYSRERIEIGDYTNIGGNVKILDHDFHPIDPADRLQNIESSIKRARIKIGKNVFIGCNTIILKGTKLGDNCVVGAGSVVTGCFPQNVVIAGNPAKIIRKLEIG